MSFRFKIIFLILSISLVPYFFVMSYFANTLRDKYHENTMVEMNTQLNLSVQRIEQYLDTLQRDMLFISRLEIMNDIYSKDVDRRISNLLDEKKSELNLDGDFHLIDKLGNIIASSDTNMLYKKSEVLAYIEKHRIETVDSE